MVNAFVQGVGGFLNNFPYAVPFFFFHSRSPRSIVNLNTFLGKCIVRMRMSLAAFVPPNVSACASLNAEYSCRKYGKYNFGVMASRDILWRCFTCIDQRTQTYKTQNTMRNRTRWELRFSFVARAVIVVVGSFTRCALIHSFELNVALNFSHAF